MKTKNERNAGRKIEGETKMISKSISLEKSDFDLIDKDFPNFSKGIQILIKDYISRKYFQGGFDSGS